MVKAPPGRCRQDRVAAGGFPQPLVSVSQPARSGRCGSQPLVFAVMTSRSNTRQFAAWDDRWAPGTRGPACLRSASPPNNRWFFAETTDGPIYSRRITGSIVVGPGGEWSVARRPRPLRSNPRQASEVRPETHVVKFTRKDQRTRRAAGSTAGAAAWWR